MFHLRHLRLVFVMTSLFVWGCSSPYIEKENVSWDAMIGTSQDNLVEKVGIPTRCHTFKSGGEVCEWPVQKPNVAGTLGTLTVRFDATGKACQWTYRDPIGERRSHSLCS